MKSRFIAITTLAICLLAVMSTVPANAEDEYQYQYSDYFYYSTGESYGSMFWVSGELDEDKVTDVITIETYHVLRSDGTWEEWNTSKDHYWQNEMENLLTIWAGMCLGMLSGLG